MPDEDVPPLSYEDTVPVLRVLQSVDVVLVGGQAVNFWSEHYIERAPELELGAPYTSKDIDFMGSRGVVLRCAELLKGRALLPEPFDPTPSSGAVIFVDGRGHERQIDIISHVLGLNDDDVRNTAIPVDVDFADPSSPRFLVMHPERCLESRAHNIVEIPGDYDTAQGRSQLRASIVATREFVRDLLAEGEIRPVLRLYKRLHQFCLSRVGVEAFIRTNMDPFSAVVLDQALPAKFAVEAHPRMAAEIATKRAKATNRAPPGKVR